MEKIEMVREIGNVQSGLIVLRGITKKTEEQEMITKMHDKLDAVVDGLIADAKNGV